MADAEHTTCLVLSTLAGSKNSFAELIESHERLVFSIAYQQLANHSDANDVAQEVFLRAYSNLGKLRRPEQFTQWLYGIALNVSREFVRKAAPEIPLDSIAEPPAPVPDDPDPRHRQVLELLAKLPAKYSLPLTLRYVYRAKYSDMADLLGITENLARNRVYRAKLMLKHRLKKHAQ